MGGGEGLPNLEFLRNNPHFQTLRQMIHQNPGLLEPILEQIAAGNPQIAQLIGQNNQQFLDLLGEEDDEAPLPPGAQAVSVTEEERDAIERVSRIHTVNLGFNADLYVSFAASDSSVTW